MIHRAKKSMGQNFLKSQQAIRTIITSGEIVKNGTVVEIGPGKGVLTEALLLAGARVIAVEKDRELLPVLEERFAEEISTGRLKLISGDILKITNDELRITNYKIIANIPYNITGAILERFLTEKNQPERMILMVQKEVAQRVVARDGKESILSLSVKAFGIPKYIEKVPARFFSPMPKVDSAILGIFDISRENFKTQEEQHFFQVLKTGFAHKRKILIGNLESIADKARITVIFQQIGISLQARPEELSINTWLALAKEIFQ